MLKYYHSNWHHQCSKLNILIARVSILGSNSRCPHPLALKYWFQSGKQKPEKEKYLSNKMIFLYVCLPDTGTDTLFRVCQHLQDCCRLTWISLSSAYSTRICIQNGLKMTTPNVETRKQSKGIALALSCLIEWEVSQNYKFSS